MKRILGLVAFSWMALLVTAGTGLAEGHHGHGGLMPPIVWKMMSPDQIKSAISADKTNLKNLHMAVWNARNQLTLDLVSGKDSSVITADQTALETAQNNLLAEKVKLAQTILANLSSFQRSQVTQFVAKWQAMQQQQRQQREALFQQFNGNTAGASDQ